MLKVLRESRIYRGATQFFKHFFGEDANLIRLTKNASWLFSGNVAVGFIGFLQAIIVARALGVKEFGLLNLVIVYVTMVNLFVDFRVWETVVKYLTEFWARQEREKALGIVKLSYSIDFITGVLAFSLTVITSGSAATYILREPEAAGLVSLFALTLIISTVDGTSQAILRVFDKFQWLSFCQVVVSGCKLIFVVLFLILGFGLQGVLYAYLLAATVGALLFNLKAFKLIFEKMEEHWWKGNIRVIREKYKEIAVFLWNTNLNAFFKMSINQLNSLILGYLRGSKEVGYYSLALSFSKLFGLLSTPFHEAIYPQIASMWAKRKLDELKRLLIESTKLMATLSTFLLLSLIVMGYWLILWFAGKVYTPAYFPMVFICIGATFSRIFFWQRAAILSVGRPEVPTYVGLLLVFIQILLSLLLVPVWGALGSAFILMILHFISNGIVVKVFLQEYRKMKLELGS